MLPASLAKSRASRGSTHGPCSLSSGAVSCTPVSCDRALYQHRRAQNGCFLPGRGSSWSLWPTLLPGPDRCSSPPDSSGPRSWRETTRLQVYMRLDPGGHLCRPRWLPVAVPTADSDVHAAGQPPGSRKLNDSCALTTCLANVPSGLLNTSCRGADTQD